MSASSSKGEGSDGEFIEADLDSYEKLFRAFMKRDSSVIDFFTTGEGSDDNAMAYPGRYSQIFREYMRWSYGGETDPNEERKKKTEVGIGVFGAVAVAAVFVMGVAAVVTYKS